MFRLDGRVAIVTGGASGIGRDIAGLFAKQGASVVVVDRDAGNLRNVVSEISGLGGRATPCLLDLCEPEAHTTIVSAALSAFGGINILVNNAGGSRASPFLQTSRELWQNMLDINLSAAFYCAQAAGREISKNPGGRIVNIASHSGIHGSPGHAAYAAAKGGLIALTRVMAVELAAHETTVNAIAPGPIDVPRTTGPGNAERRAAWMRAIPLHRSGKTSEIASVALFLASAESSYVTGQVLSADGGFAAAGLMV